MVRMAAQETMPTLKVGIWIYNCNMSRKAQEQNGEHRILNIEFPAQNFDIRRSTFDIQDSLRSYWSNAFTFIEVLIALAVVSIALLALLRFCLLSIKLADKAHITSQAVFLAEEKISQTLAVGYPKKGTDSGTVQNNGVLFNWQVEVAEAYLPGLDKPHIEGLRKISVDVSWKQTIGRNHLQMSTYVADKSILRSTTKDETYHEP